MLGRGWSLTLLVALQIVGAIESRATSADGIAPPSPSSEIRALADRANALRGKIRASERSSPDSSATVAARHELFDSLISLAGMVMEAPPEPGQARVLLHVERSLELLDLDPSNLGEQTRHHAMSWLSRIDSIATEAGDWALAAHARVRRARIYARSGDLDAALLLARQAAFDAARAPHAESLYRAQWLIGAVSRKQAKPNEALAAYRSAVRTLEQLRPGGAAPGDDADFAFRQQVEPVYLGLVDLLLEAARASKAVNPSAEQPLLREARAVLEQSKEAELRDYFRDECLASTATPSDAIAGAVVVYPISLEDRVEIVVSREGHLSSHLASIGGAELASLARELRRALEDPTTRSYLPRAEALYDALIRPIEARLRDAPVSTLVFVPNGPLRQIPMAALRDRETGRFLVERFAVAVIPSLTLIDPQRIDRSDAELLVAGLTQGVQGFTGLPHVAEEIAAAGAQFPAHTLVDERFVAADFEQLLREKPFEVVHIASHGEFSANASQSFVLTWDGRLTFERLAKLLAQTRFRTKRPVEILILSACETALGDDRAALGLAGAAIRMGARSVLASLWSIDDLASSRLIARFYAELADPAKSRAEALQRAQVWMLSQEEFRHPANWAAFLLISSWL